MDLIRSIAVVINPEGAVAGGRTAEGAFRGVGNAAKGMEGSSRSAGSALSYLKATLAAVGAGTFARELYQTSVSLDRLQGQLKAASGSADEFRKTFAFLRGESDKFGLDLVSAGNAFNRFAQEARGKMAGEQIKAVFNSVAEASAVLQLSGEQTTNVLSVMGQMMARGAVDGRQLKTQLQDIPQVLTTLADSYGVTEKQMLRMLETGNILGSDVVPRLAKSWHEDYGPKAAAAAHGLEQEMNRLKNTWKEFHMVFMSSGGESLFAKAINVARAALDDLKMTMAALFQASSEGGLSEAIAASLRVGFGKAANYFGGFVKTATEMLTEAGKVMFTADYFTALLTSFQAVAAGFGLALLRALEKPLTSVQGFFRYAFDHQNAAIPYQANELARKTLFRSGEFAGLTDTQLSGRFGALTRTPEEAARLEKYNTAVGALTETLKTAMGYKTVGDFGNDVSKDGGLMLGFSGSGKSLSELEAINQQNLTSSLSSLVKQTADAGSAALLKLKDFKPTNSVDTSADEGLLKGLYGRSKNMFAGKPQASAGIAPEPPVKSWVEEMKDGIAESVGLLGTLEQRAKEIGKDSVDAMSRGFTGFFDSIIDGTDSVISAFRKMTASILSDVAKIIAQQMIARPLAGWAMTGISALLGGGTKIPASAPVGDFGSGFIGSSIGRTAHTGGLIGSTLLSSKLVNPSIFNFAPRLHSGLRPDEFPAILQRGEEVIPRGGRGGGGSPVVFNNTVNVDGGKGGTPEQNQKLGAEITRQLQGMMQEQIARALMPRGVLSMARA